MKPIWYRVYSKQYEHGGDWRYRGTFRELAAAGAWKNRLCRAEGGIWEIREE